MLLHRFSTGTGYSPAILNFIAFYYIVTFVCKAIGSYGLLLQTVLRGTQLNYVFKLKKKCDRCVLFFGFFTNILRFLAQRSCLCIFLIKKNYFATLNIYFKCSKETVRNQLDLISWAGTEHIYLKLWIKIVKSHKNAIF